MDELLTRLARDADRRYYGKYRGEVTDNADPEKRGRVKLVVRGVLGETETTWAQPVLPFGGLPDVGFLFVPEVGAEVWVEFEAGDVSLPLWAGFQWPKGQASGDDETGDPARRILATPSGHRLELDDTSGAEKLVLRHAGGAAVTLDDQGGFSVVDSGGAGVVVDAQAGSLTVSDANGNSLVLDASGVIVEDAAGNRLELAAAGVTVKGQRVAVQGQQVALG